MRVTNLQLLPILLAEIGAIGSHLAEQFRAHRGHTAEMSRPLPCLPTFSAGSRHVDRGDVHLAGYNRGHVGQPRQSASGGAQDRQGSPASSRRG